MHAGYGTDHAAARTMPTSSSAEVAEQFPALGFQSLTKMRWGVVRRLPDVPPASVSMTSSLSCRSSCAHAGPSAMGDEAWELCRDPGLVATRRSSTLDSGVSSFWDMLPSSKHNVCCRSSSIDRCRGRISSGSRRAGPASGDGEPSPE